MEEWFREGDFGKRCQAAFQRSRICADGFLNNQYFKDLLVQQMEHGGGYSFQLWTVLNAVLWHESWIEGRRDCL
jgi:asparagine synthase (glutamine-hydrolysing)